MAEANAFSGGADFIFFGPPSPSQAGPSRSRSHSRSSSAVPKGKKRKAADAVDAADGGGKKKGKENKKEGKHVDAQGGQKKKKDKGKGKARSNDANGIQSLSEDGATGPRNLKEERRAAERGCPWVDMVDWERCGDPAEMLNSEIQAFYRYLSPTRAEYEVRLFIIELISRTVRNTWPDAEVHPFGSWQTQLYLPSGDIDIVVTTPRLSAINKAKLLAELARAMRLAYITNVVAIISKARVPIIKFITTQGNLNVDISLNQTNGINAGMILNQYLDILPGARQLIVVVKAFLSQRSMNEVYTGGLGSYAVICLVISFLQVHPKLRRSEIDPERNLGTLLIEFFELYGRNFNYDDVGLSIRRGGFYYAKRSRGWYKANQPYALSIEDPQDKDNDISSGSYGIRQVRATLAGAFEMLQAKLFERAENMHSAEMDGREYFEESDPEDMSILSGIMGVTKETLKHRHELLRLHQEGRLQRMLEISIGVDPLTVLPQYQPRRSPPPEPPRSPVRRKAPANGHGGPQGMQAIIVNDDEIDLGDLDSEFSDPQAGVTASRPEEDDGSENDSEDDRVVEVISDGSTPRQADRFASVSEDDYEGTPQREASRPTHAEDGDSRYALGKGSKHPAGKKGANGKRRMPLRTGSDSDDDSVVAVDPPSSSSQAPTSRARNRRDFWAAKGRVAVAVEDDDEDEDD